MMQNAMLYLIIEKFYPGKVKELYQRLDTEGRFLPDGVTYVGSWIDENIETCYQVMDSPSREKLQEWMDHWAGYCEWEVMPVITSAQAKEKVLGRL
ncbi:MAG: DUF3303 family protein [Lewinellaceae bacterium]|nr:DUF3303 family protein [Lewinellaceae bacterium]